MFTSKPQDREGDLLLPAHWTECDLRLNICAKGYDRRGPIRRPKCVGSTKADVPPLNLRWGGEMPEVSSVIRLFPPFPFGPHSHCTNGTNGTKSLCPAPPDWHTLACYHTIAALGLAVPCLHGQSAELARLGVSSFVPRGAEKPHALAPTGTRLRGWDVPPKWRIAGD